MKMSFATCVLAVVIGLSAASATISRAMAALPDASLSVQVKTLDAVPGAGGWQVTDRASGATLAVYFDAASEQLARETLPEVLAMLRSEAETLGVPAADVRWFSVQFTQDPAITAALRAKSLGTWRVPTQADGRLAQGRGLEDGEWALRTLLPHEQAHAVDAQHIRRGLDMPYWWIEGLATWVEMHTARRLHPAWWAAHQTTRLAQEQAELQAADGQIDLRRMDRSSSPRVEAILRQLSPPQQAAFLADGTLPPIALVFTEEDMEQSPHMGAHYVAAARLFERVEREAGLAKMQAWFRAIASEPAGTLDSARIAALCLQTTGVDITGDLDNRSARR